MAVIGKRSVSGPGDDEGFDRVPDPEFAQLPEDYGEWDEERERSYPYEPSGFFTSILSPEQRKEAEERHRYIMYLMAKRRRSCTIGSRPVEDDPSLVRPRRPKTSFPTPGDEDYCPFEDAERRGSTGAMSCTVRLRLGRTQGCRRQDRQRAGDGENETMTTTETNIDLGLCNCGGDATWYRTAPPPPEKDRKRSALSNITLDDVDENLCDGCYKGFTGSLDTAAAGWKRVDTLQRQGRAGEDDQDSRAPWDEGFGGDQGGSDDW